MDKLLKIITDVNSSVNNFIWGVPSMICIVGVGLWLLIRNRGVQFTKFGYAFKHTFGKIFNKKETSDGAISPFQAVCTALAGTVGTGNIAGVAGAIAIGGPGAVFWMWISALLGMGTKFAEVVLAVFYREKDSNETNQVVIGKAEGTFSKSTSTMEEITASWYTKEEVKELLKNCRFAARTQAFCYMWAKGGC